MKKWFQGEMMKHINIVDPELQSALTIIEGKLLYDSPDVLKRKKIAQFEKLEDAKIAARAPDLVREARELIDAIHLSAYPFRTKEGQVMDAMKNLEKLLGGIDV